MQTRYQSNGRGHFDILKTDHFLILVANHIRSTREGILVFHDKEFGRFWQI